MDALVSRILLDFSLDDYEPIFQRSLDLGEPEAPHVGNLVTVVSGIRRCGKSYRLFQEMRRLERAGVPRGRMLYFNFDDNRLDLGGSAVADQVLDTFYELNPGALEEGAYLFLDEVQEVPGWDAWMRRVVDTRKVTVYVTGSSSKLLSSEIASAFRGRSVVYEMSPLSFAEYVRFHLPQADLGRGALGAAERVRVRRLFASYLETGGFPAVQRLGAARRVMVLQSYAQQVTTRDVIDRHNLGNPRAVAGFAQRLLAMSGHEVSLRKVENDLRSQGVVMGRGKLAKVLGYLEDAFLVATVGDYTRSLDASPRTAPKVYGADPGLVLANSKASAQDLGQRLETAVYLELRRRNALGRRQTIGSGRTRGHGYEVDFVVGDALLDPGDAQLYQVCAHPDADPKTREREVRALREAMAEHGVGTSWLLTMDDEGGEVQVPEGTVVCKPTWEWCLGL
jgi:hypothetical protein